MKANIPSQALFRLEGRPLSEIIDVNPKIPFDDLTHLASSVTQTPIAFISFFDPSYHWLKSQIGFRFAPSIYLDFCEYAICFKQQLSRVETPNGQNLKSNLSSQASHLWPFLDQLAPEPDPILIPDVLVNPQLASHPLVRGESSIRFYAGLPLLTTQGQILGLLSVMDSTPRTLSAEMLSSLAAVSRQIINLIESRHQIINLSRKFNQLETLIHQRQNVWEMIRQERDFIGAVLNTISALVIVVDRQGKIIRFNHACVQLTGYSADTVEGRTLEELGLSIFDIEIEAGRFWQTGQSFPYTCETLWKLQDGSTHWIAWSNTVLLDEKGEAKSIIATGIDITARQKSEERLRLLERAIAASPNGIIITDTPQSDCPIIYCNSAFERLTGYSASEVFGRNCRFLQGPDTDPHTIAQLHQAIHTEQDCSVTLRNYRKDGTPFWNELAISPVRDGMGRLTHFVGIQTDVTQRKQAEDALRESESRYRLLADNATDLITRHTTDGIYLYVSPACRQLLGYEPEELVGHSVYELFHPEDLDGVRTFHQSLTSLYEIFTLSYRIRHKQGHWIWVETTCHRIDQSSGETQQELVSVSRNITERKLAEVMLFERSRLSMLEAEVGVALGHGKTILGILDRCTQAIAKYLDGTGVAIWLLNSRNQKFTLQAVAGQQIPQTWISRKVQSETSLQAILEQPLSQSQQGALALQLPLRVDERLLGMMAISSFQPFTEMVQEGLGWVANSLAIGIDRVQVRQELQSRREAVLFRLASQIRDSLDIDTILGRAVNEIRTLLQIDQCLFLWCLPMQSQQDCFCITHEAISATLSQRIQEYPADKINWLAEKIRLHDTVQIDDLEEITEIDLQTWEFFTVAGITSVLLLPLETRSGQRGAVACHHYSGPRSWSASEVELLQGVVDQLAIAIDQAELYAQTRAAALAAQTQAFHLTEALQDLQQKEAQLIQSEKMSSLGQMVAGVAHEINNPVNFIYGNLTYAKDYIQDLLELIHLYQEYYPEPISAIQAKADDMELNFLIEDLPKILSSMEMGADRIRQIVVSLRNFSRLDEAEMKPVDIHEGIDSTLLILQNRLKSKSSNTGIEIIKEYGTLPRVECYAGQLNQVFMNLLSNAIDALENQPEPRIISIQTDVVHPVPNSSPNRLHQIDQVRIKIRDNGPGIDEKVKSRLFDPFFTTKPVGKGTGLGLSISYKIVVEQHEGKILCYGDEEGYTVFEVCIPIHQRYF